MTHAEDPSADTQRHPWPADADWGSGDGENPAASLDEEPTPAQLLPSQAKQPGLSEAELADEWLRKLGLHEARPTNPAAGEAATEADSQPAPPVPRSPLDGVPSATGQSEPPQQPLPRAHADAPPAVDREAGIDREATPDPVDWATKTLPDGEARSDGEAPSKDEAEDPHRPPWVGPAPPPVPPALAAMTTPVQLLPPRVPLARRRQRRSRVPRRPVVSLAAVVLLALTTAFFAWVSAEPFWLAVGHGHTGTATIFAAPSGCRARFVADDATFTVSTVGVAGLRSCPDGASVPAHMVSADGRRAFVTDQGGFNARWSIGFGLVLLCGLGIAATTGAGGLPGWRAAATVGLSLAAPAVLTLVSLAAAY